MGYGFYLLTGHQDQRPLLENLPKKFSFTSQ